MVDNTFDRLTKRIAQKAREKESKRKVEPKVEPSAEEGRAVERPPKAAKSSPISEPITMPSGQQLHLYEAYIDPNDCRIWEGNNRLDETRNDNSLDELKELIEAQGQLIPGFVRPIIGDADHKYEVIYGSRRFTACSELDKRFYCLVGEVTDKDALILMDAENNARKELSVYEKALSYRKWLKEKYFKNREDLASHLGISKTWVSRIQSILELPEEVLEAFNSKADIKISWAMELLRICKKSDKSKENLVEVALKKPAKYSEPEEVYHYLVKYSAISAMNKPKAKKKENSAIPIKNKSGDVVCKLKQGTDGKVQAVFSKDLSLDDIKEKLEQLYTQAEEATWEF